MKKLISRLTMKPFKNPPFIDLVNGKEVFFYIDKYGQVYMSQAITKLGLLFSFRCKTK